MSPVEEYWPAHMAGPDVDLTKSYRADPHEIFGSIVDLTGTRPIFPDRIGAREIGNIPIAAATGVRGGLLAPLSKAPAWRLPDHGRKQVCSRNDWMTLVNLATIRAMRSEGQIDWAEGISQMRVFLGDLEDRRERPDPRIVSTLQHAAGRPAGVGATGDPECACEIVDVDFHCGKEPPTNLDEWEGIGEGAKRILKVFPNTLTPFTVSVPFSDEAESAAGLDSRYYWAIPHELWITFVGSWTCCWFYQYVWMLYARFDENGRLLEVASFADGVDIVGVPSLATPFGVASKLAHQGDGTWRRPSAGTPGHDEHGKATGETVPHRLVPLRGGGVKVIADWPHVYEPFMGSDPGDLKAKYVWFLGVFFAVAGGTVGGSK